MKKCKIIKYLMIVSIMVITAISVNADIYISEVLYNPFNTESGGEAVELYNSGDSLDISGYTIKTASSVKDATLPGGSIIPSNGYYLVADNNWHEKKDSILYPLADHEEAITMTNTAAGVALIDNNNNTVDIVGWGNPSSIDLSLYSGTPADNSENGESLRRISFTGDNSLDFISSVPMLVNSRGEDREIYSNAINLNINVNNPEVKIENITLDFDFEDKIILKPGNQRVLNLTFTMNNHIQCDNLYAEFINEIFNAEFLNTVGSDNIFSSNIILDFFVSPDNYTIDVICEIFSTESSSNISFEILPLMAFEIDLSDINCTLGANEFCLINGDLDISTIDRPTIKNLGNRQLDFKVSGNNLSNNQNTIDIRNVKFSFDVDNPVNVVSNDPVLYNVGLATGENSMLPISLLVTIPAVDPGQYNSRLLFIGVSDE